MSNRYLFSFTPAEAAQLASYVKHRDDGRYSGWYFGNKDQFEARHRRILEELNNSERAYNKALAIVS